MKQRRSEGAECTLQETIEVVWSVHCEREVELGWLIEGAARWHDSRDVERRRLGGDTLSGMMNFEGNFFYEDTSKAITCSLIN